MNLVTLLGAAIGNKEIGDLFLKSPERAASRLGILLTELERDYATESLKALNAMERRELAGQFNRIRMLLCRKPPCPYEVILPGRKPQVKARNKEIAKQKAAAA